MQRITVTFTIFLFIWFAIEAFAQPMPVGNALSGVPSQPKEKPTIAVTTFENLSAFPENAWVAMSFSEALTVKLKRLYERFRVVERMRVYEVIREQGVDPETVDRLETAKQRDVGSLLGANYLILGSVSLQGDADDLKTPLLANLRVVDVQTGEIQEAQSIRGEMERLFELETQLAFALLKQMGVEPTPEEAEKLSLKETLSIIANKYYSLGQKAFYDGDYETAKNLYDKALEALGGQYYQAAELSLIEVLERQKAAADEAQKAQIKAEALRRRSESERKRAEANQRLFAEAKYSMLAEEYETAVERYQQYLDWAKPFRQVRWKRAFEAQISSQPPQSVQLSPAYQPLLHEGILYVALFNRARHSDSGRSSSQYVYAYLYRLDALDAKTGEVLWQFKTKEDPESTTSLSSGEAEAPESPIVLVEGTVYAPVDNTHIVAIDKNTGELLWEFKRGKRNEINDDDWPLPQVTDGVVSVKFWDGMLFALSARTGEIKWQLDTGTGGVKSVFASDGRVYVASMDGLLALSAQTGEELWRAFLKGAYTLPSPWSHLRLLDKAAIEHFSSRMKAQFQAALPNLSKEQAKESEEGLKQLERFFQPYLDKSGVWVMEDNSQTGLRGGDLILKVDGTPLRDYEQFVAVIRGKKTLTTRTLTILRGEEEKILTVEQTGVQETGESLPGPFFSPVIRADSDTLYVGTTFGVQGTIYALKKTTGEIIWEYRASPMGVYGLAVGGKRLIAYSSPDWPIIYVLGTERGELIWKAEGLYPLIATERVYMLDRQGVSARSLETGEVIWQVKRHDPRDIPEPKTVTETTPKTVTETTVYLSSSTFEMRRHYSSAKLHAIDTKTGEELWHLPLDDEVKDVLIGEDGAVYLTTTQLYALGPKPKGLLPEQEEHEVMLGIGTALVALGRYEGAIPKLLAALELHRDLKETHWQLTLAYEGMEQWKEAARERNEYLARTPYPSARPDVKVHLYERFGIQKWASGSEPDFDIRRHVPVGFLERAPEMGAMPRRLQWGGVTIPTIIEGNTHFLRENYEFGEGGEGSGVSYNSLLRREEWGQVEVLGRGYVMMQRASWDVYRPEWVEESRRFTDGERIYIEFILIDEITGSENGTEYQSTSVLGAFSKKTGELLWRFQTERSNRDTMKFFISALLVSEVVYWGIEGRLYALDKETGALRWEFHDEATPQLFTHGRSIEKKGDDFTAVSRTFEGWSSERQTLLVAAEGSVYIIEQEPLFALSAQTGQLLWKKSIPNLHKSPVRVHAERVYVLAGSELYVLRADTGETDWSIKADGGISGCVLDEERVYLRTSKGLHLFSSETGKFQWEFSSSIEKYSPEVTHDIIVGEKTVYLYGKPFYALDKVTGEVRWGIDGFRHSLPGIEAEEILYLYSSDPTVLYAFDLLQIDKLRAEGKQWWTFGWQFYRDKARSSQKRGMLLSAIAEYKEAIKRAPEPEVLWLYAELGEVYYEQGNLEAAEEMYTKTGLPRETDWLVIGPFDNTDDKGRTHPYPPETEINMNATYQGKTGAVQWQKAEDGHRNGRLDFTRIFTPTEWVLAYALIDVISPDDREAFLRIGSDDGIKVWLNGQVVWTNQVSRGLQIDQDVVPIVLKKGNNRLLFKVDQGIRGWLLAVRITDVNGQPLEGLRFQAPVWK